MDFSSESEEWDGHAVEQNWLFTMCDSFKLLFIIIFISQETGTELCLEVIVDNDSACFLYLLRRKKRDTSLERERVCSFR
jgi:hypothetical protein